MNKNRGLTPLAAVLMLSGSLVLTGCNDKETQQQGAHQQAPEVGVVTLKAEPLNITTDLSPRRTAAYRIAEVRPQVSGIILKRNFVEGSDIKAGTSLYQIDPATYQASYDSAKGDLAKAQASASIARVTVNRYKPLLGTSYISKQDYDNAVSTLQQADAAVVATKAAVETARINFGVHQGDLPDLRPHRQIRRDRRRAGQQRPCDRPVHRAAAGSDVCRRHPVEHRLPAPEARTASGALKQENGKAKVKLMLENGAEYAQEGTLEFSDVTVDETTGSITIRALFPNPNDTLLPGMFVRARLDEGVRSDALLVPQQGVTRNPARRGDGVGGRGRRQS